MNTSDAVLTRQLKLQKRRAAYQRRKCRERDLLKAEKNVIDKENNDDALLNLTREDTYK